MDFSDCPGSRPIITVYHIILPVNSHIMRYTVMALLVAYAHYIVIHNIRKGEIGLQGICFVNII